MSKKYKVKYAGRIYEVTKEQYEEIRREQRRHRYLESTQNGIVVLSYDALEFDNSTQKEILVDRTVDVEEDAIKNILLEKLRGGLATLTDDELYIIEHLIYQEKTERELAKKLNVTQQAISKKSKKILNKLKKFLEN